MPSISQVLLAIQEELDKLLAEKTSWGRNEVKSLFQQAKANALARFL